jgi:transcriptional regulator with XRE-family HTH domain
MDYGFVIKELRENCNCSLGELAKATNLDYNQLKEIEEGKLIEPDKKSIDKLARYFKIPKSAFELLAFTEKDVNPDKIEGYRALRPSLIGLIKAASIKIKLDF